MSEASFASGFATGFGVVDQALTRRRQMSDMERRTSLAERAQGFSERATNRKLNVFENTDRRAQFGQDRQSHLDAATVAEKRAGQITQQILERAKAGEDYDDLLIEFGNADQELHGATDRFVGFLNEGSQIAVSGTRADGSQFEGLPATHGAVPVDEGGEPIEGARDGLLARAAAMNPNLAAHLEGEREKVRTRGALGELARHMDGSGYGGGVGSGDQQLDQQAEQQAFRGPVELENPFEGPLQPGFRRLSRRDLNIPTDIPGLEFLDRFDQMNVPDWFQSLEEMRGMPVAEVAAQEKRQHDWIMAHGGTSGPNAYGQQAVKQQKQNARELGDKWGSFLNHNDPDGKAMRLAFAEDPDGFISEQYLKERNSLSPADRRRLDQQMWGPMLDQRDRITEELAQFQPAEGSGDLWDLSTPEAKAAHRRLKRNLGMERAIRDEYSVEEAAEIVGGNVRVGNEVLNAQIIDALENRPMAWAPRTHDQVRAATAVARTHQTNERPGGGRNRVSGALLDALPVLLDAGMVDMKGIHTLLETGSLSGFTFHNMGSMGLHRQNPDGSVTPMVYPSAKPTAPGDAAAAAREQRQAMEQARNMFNENYQVLEDLMMRQSEQMGLDEKTARGRFYDLSRLIGQGGAETMEQFGTGKGDFSQLTQPELIQILERYNSFEAARNDSTKRWWDRATQVIRGTTPLSEVFRGDARQRKFDRENTIYNFDGGAEATGMPQTIPELYDGFLRMYGPEQMGNLILDAREQLINQHGMDHNRVSRMDDEDVFRAVQELRTKSRTTGRAGQ